MNIHKFIRTIYRQASTLPLVGPIVVAMRYRRLPEFSGFRHHYAEQQNLLEAHGQALAGIRECMGRIADEQRNLFEAHEDALTGLRSGLVRVEEELYSQVHIINQKVDKQFDVADQRIEFVRKEILYELRYGLQESVNKKSHARILNPEKVNLFKLDNRLRLNVGCGHKPDADRINVDMRELPHVDIVATVDDLPFGTGEISEIYSAHLLEHFTYEHLMRKLLPQWCLLLASGGELRAVVPDGEAMLKAYSLGEVSFENMRLVMYGAQDYEGDFHHTMFTPESLMELFAAQGLENIRILDRQRRNGLCYEFEVIGVKP